MCACECVGTSVRGCMCIDVCVTVHACACVRACVRTCVCVCPGVCAWSCTNTYVFARYMHEVASACVFVLNCKVCVLC